MDWTYVHLTTNHFPVIGAIFGTLILAWGIFRGERSVWYVGLWIMVFTGLIAIPVYLTGEPAEETVEHLPGVLESIIEEHEEFAKFGLISAIVSGITALASLAFLRSDSEGGKTKLLLFATLALSAITVGMMGWTAKLGGVVRHTEIRAASAQTPAAPQTRKDDDDDD